MKYMLLIYYDEQVLEKAGKIEEARIERECLEKNERIKEKILGSNRLHPVATATCVRTKEGKQFVTDGPSRKLENNSAATPSSRLRIWTKRSKSPRACPRDAWAPSRYAR